MTVYIQISYMYNTNDKINIPRLYKNHLLQEIRTHNSIFKLHEELEKKPLLQKEDTLIATFLKMLKIIDHQEIESKTSIIYHCIPTRITIKSNAK